jgi:hypothetical protein
MIPCYTEEEFNSARYKDKLLCQCSTCFENFYKSKQEIIKHLKTGHLNSCNPKRQHTYSNREKVLVSCLECKNEFYKFKHEINRSPNNLCSRSCAASYRNKNKTKGNRRSKLEIWIEEKLTQLYPNLSIHFNKKDAIGSELDVYIPSLNIAFELNGIFHYEPIYGINKFKQIQKNDKNKFQLCFEHNIDLCIIDTSGQKYVKPSTSQKYLDIIDNIIKERLLETKLRINQI